MVALEEKFEKEDSWIFISNIMGIHPIAAKTWKCSSTSHLFARECKQRVGCQVHRSKQVQLLCSTNYFTKVSVSADHAGMLQQDVKQG